MSSLFILNNPDKLQQCLAYVSEQDGLLVIEDGVIAATLQPASCAGAFVLGEDLAARGLQDKLKAGWQAIDYDRFVRLTLEYDKAVSWL